ncbi:MAG: efflux RND transporter permease subunit, partial [Spirochaetes bacterium]|nr:efflux RND transporter permease subunit [Spirochaetota bacterium]
FYLKRYNISLTSILSSIRSRNIRSTGGTIQSVTKNKNIVTIGQFKNPMDVKDVIIRANYEGKRIYIKDLAKVGMGFKEKTKELFINQKKGITVSIVKNENADISQTIENVKNFIEKNKKNYQEKYLISTIDDRSLSIKALLDVVQYNALIGFILVFIILLIFLNFRSAFWTAFGIPSTIFITLIFMYLYGISLNIITLGALITVLGMMVDDAIVISENIHNYKMKGYSAYDAGYKGLTEVLFPVTVSILTTIVAFLPLLAIKGKMGLFISVFPIIVTVALLGSLFESVFILPQHVIHGKIKNKESKEWFDFIAQGYKKLLIHILKFRYLVLLFFVILLIITIVISSNVFAKFILIKDDSSDTLLINLEAAAGTNLGTTTKLTKNIEKQILSAINKEEIIAVNTIIGHHRVKKINDRGNRENWAQVGIYLVPSTKRKRNVNEIVKSIKKKIKDNNDFEKIIFSKKIIGPDPGKGVDVKIAGNNIKTLIELVKKIENHLKTIQGVTDIDNTNKPGKEEIILDFDYIKMAKLNIDVSAIAETVKTAYDGVIVTSIQLPDKKLDFRLEMDNNFKGSVRFLNDLLIPNKQGRLIKLDDISKIKIKPGICAIDHYNG